MGFQSKADLKAMCISFDQYVLLARITLASVLFALATHYVKNSLSAGSLPCSKKPLLVSLASLLAVFPGILSLLPSPPDGLSDYPPGFKFVAWLASPASKRDSNSMAGAFFPMCKPYDDWVAYARAGGKSDPSTSAHLWSPITLVHAMVNNPAKVMGLPDGTSKTSAALKLCNALRKADWNIKRFVLLAPMYLFIQNHIVEPAFRYYESSDIAAALARRHTAIVLVGKCKEVTIDTTKFILAYHTFVINPRVKENYHGLLRLFCGSIDRFPGYQCHQWNEHNRPVFLERVESDTPAARRPTDPQPSAEHSPAAAAAGSSARQQQSPGNPGVSKVPRYVDAARPKVVPTALFGTPAAAAAPAAVPAAAPSPAVPGGFVPPTPAYGAGYPPAMPAAPGVTPPGYPAAGHGFPGYGGMPYPGFPGFPGYPGYPWPPQHQAPGAPPAYPPPQ